MIARVRRRSSIVLVLLFAAACAKKPAQAPPPPQPKQNLVVLLPEPEGESGGVVLTNPAGSETLTQPYQATRVENSNTAPTAPFTMDASEVRRIFGAALDALPTAEAVFTLYFDEDKDTLVPDSEARLGAILSAIRERRSTAISVIGHTDTTSTPQHNYELGLRRAERVAGILRSRGVEDANLDVGSHGETDLAVSTARNVAEVRNRRVEVTVR